MKKTKHFEVVLHFVKENDWSGILRIVKIDSSNQNAYILTKSLVS